MAGSGRDIDLSDTKNPLYALTRGRENYEETVNMNSNRGATLPRTSRDVDRSFPQATPISESQSLTAITSYETMTSAGGARPPPLSDSSDSDDESMLKPRLGHSHSTNQAHSRQSSQEPSPDSDTVFDNSHPKSIVPQRADMVRKPSKQELENAPVERICPRVNCQEKIVLCVDISSEMASTNFRSRSGERFNSVNLLKRAVAIFLHSKHMLDARHEFALVVLHDSAEWIIDFTNSPNDIIQELEATSTMPCEALEMGSVFDTVKRHVSLPYVEDPHVLPPPYIVRVILLYGRSHSQPTFMHRESLQHLQNSPHFFVDAFYIHEPQSEDNKCEDIFNMICDLDESGLSYIQEVSRNPTKLYDYMAQLLAHPLQRPLQKDVDYSIEPEGEPIYM